MRTHSRAFTLIELLVIELPVIAILVAIPFPVFAQANTGKGIQTETLRAQSEAERQTHPVPGRFRPSPVARRSRATIPDSDPL